MTQYIPITLLGNNLGERHRHLNILVDDTFKSSVAFESIQDRPEATPVDRIFKIELASKHRNVNYILQNLKDADLLYVSRALKCAIWLLEPQYNSIIKPDYLENVLFPDMISPAVSKMRHWLQHHLHDPDRCRDFYIYYKNCEFDIAFKFLWRCSNDYLFEEFVNIMTIIKPKHLKILSEKCPKLTKIFYEQLEQDLDVLKHYLEHENDFLQNIKYLLKSDPDTFFDITEKYYNVQKNRSFRSDITRYIIQRHKDKFFNKAELYTVHFLDMKALSECLSPEEAKELVFRLAKAEYLENWFTYKTVEPLIKRLDKDGRVALKKKIFVEKDLGDKIKEWPYSLPSSPMIKEQPGFSLFLDKIHNPNDYAFSIFKLKKKKMKLRSMTESFLQRSENCRNSEKTLLNELFDHYRFASFESTLSELGMRLRTESSSQNHQFIMLVLVSKCGGSESNLKNLLRLLKNYKNEPVNLRATIVRSLVKRAFVWRLPADLWGDLLEWAHGLGLDGSSPEAACKEGLHAVVLRDLLANQTSTPAVRDAFFNLFTTFNEYSLTVVERNCVRTRLPNLLLDAINLETGQKKLNHFNQLLDSLEAYKIPYGDFPGVITAIKTAAHDDPENYKDIVDRLFHSRAGRRELFQVNFTRIQNNESYVNALRHDVTVLSAEKFKDLHDIEENTYKRRLRFDQFLRKLAIYFSEVGGLADNFYTALKIQAEAKPHRRLGRLLALLAGEDLTNLIKTFDCDTKRLPKTAKQSLASALRANAHVSRPPLNLDLFGWQAAGVKAVANLISISPKNKREDMIINISTWKRALLLALAITENEETKCAVYKILVASRPGAALKAFLRYLKNEKFGSEFLTIWNTVKPLITQLDYENRKRLYDNLDKVNSIPAIIESEYYVLVYKVYSTKYSKIDDKRVLRILCKIENICFEVDSTFLYNTLHFFLENDFTTLEKVMEEDFDIYRDSANCLYIRIIAKFLLLCSSEEIQKKRLEVIGEVFFARFEKLWKDPSNTSYLITLLFDFLNFLKYNKVFFDDRYVSCMPVLERVVLWMQNMVLPIDKWFDVYVNIHLTMVYHKAARYCITNKPEYFNIDDITNLNKGVDMFGFIFGKMFAHEYEELISKYFQSVREIYKKELMDYFATSLDYESYDESKEKFVIAFVRSILSEIETSEAHFVALHVFKEHLMFHFEYDYDLSDIVNILKGTKNKELRFYFEMMLTDDSAGLDKVKSYLELTT